MQNGEGSVYAAPPLGGLARIRDIREAAERLTQSLMVIKRFLDVRLENGFGVIGLDEAPTLEELFSVALSQLTEIRHATEEFV